MARDVPKFEATRLTVARLRNRLTKAKLAEDVGVSLRMIAAYELGEKAPGEETLESLARVLKFPVEFFQREALDLPSFDAASFRALARRTSRERDAALAAGALAMEFTAWLNANFKGIPVPALPDMRSIEPETAAALLRKQWNLGQKRIANAIQLVELHGVRVFSMSEPGKNIDAFSVWREDAPFIFLNTQKSAEHSRHDTLHELGHLILHRHGGPSGPIAEREADEFASAMLLPREELQTSAVRFPTLDALIPLKRKWGVSLASYVYRLHRIGMLSKWHYHTLFVEMSERGYRTSEPNGIPRESSLLLGEVFAQLRKVGKSRRDVARELAMPMDELEKLVFGLVMSAVQGSGGSVRTPAVTGIPKLSAG